MTSSIKLLMSTIQKLDLSYCISTYEINNQCLSGIQIPYGYLAERVMDTSKRTFLIVPCKEIAGYYYVFEMFYDKVPYTGIVTLSTLSDILKEAKQWIS